MQRSAVQRSAAQRNETQRERTNPVRRAPPLRTPLNAVMERTRASGYSRIRIRYAPLV